MAVRTIRAWLEFLTTPVPRHVRTMGYVRELRALRARRHRCRNAWQPHLERTRALVRAAAARCERRRRALIVGSGLLFDVPLEDLSRQFDQVVLVDIVHLWSVHLQASRFPNVELLPLDVTGVVERCHALAGEASARAGLPVSLPQRRADCLLGEPFDLVASINVLSQLPVVPNGYLFRRVRSLTDAQRHEFSRALVSNHLDWMCSFPGTACLITDLERLHVDDCGRGSREGSLWGVELPDGGCGWEWDLAPKPEMHADLDVRHHVVGYASFPKQDWLRARRRRDAETDSTRADPSRRTRHAMDPAPCAPGRSGRPSSRAPRRPSSDFRATRSR